MAGIDGKVFASKAKSGEIADFPDIERGWGVTEKTGYIPTMEHFNGFGKRIDLHINELNRIKANIDDIFTKTQSDERYLKKDALPSYTKQEVDNLLKNKRDNDETSFGAGQLTFKEFLLDLSDCDPDTYYPCVSSPVSVFEEATFKILFGIGSLNEGNKKDWMTAGAGFSMSTEWTVNGSGYGNAEIVRSIKKVKWLFVKNNQSPILKIDQFSPTSQEYFYLRGGGRYTVYVNRGINIVAHKEAVDVVASDGVKITLPPIKYDASLVPEKTQRSLVPAGTIIQSASQATPQGYLKCNGASISRSDYQKLFKAIGTTFGSDDNNSFKLPDLRGRFVRGFSDGSSIDSDRGFGSSQEDDLKRHAHAFPISYQGSDNYVAKTYIVKAPTTQNLFTMFRDSPDAWQDNAIVMYKDQESVNNTQTRGDLTYTGNSLSLIHI